MRIRPDAQYHAYDEEMLQVLEKDFEQTQEQLSPFACRDAQAVRRIPETFHPARPNFVKDTERILNCWYFNRYADKTQVFSLYRNDDITRRIQHVQIVSRIARSAGRMLRLNQDVIEAIALAHDLGHTPFGHLGENFLNDLLLDSAGIPFKHNVQGVRILDHVLGYNLTLQTLDGILAHNGRPVCAVNSPDPYSGTPEEMFLQFEARQRQAQEATREDERVISATLEGCVVRIADILAYLGKDRQDAQVLKMDTGGPFEPNEVLGSTNSEFIFNAVENIVRNSYGKPNIELSEEYALAIRHEKRVNYEKIYAQQNMNAVSSSLRRMFERVFERCVEDIETHNEDSLIYRHHILKCVGNLPDGERRVKEYLKDGAPRIAADYLASMTDDYLMDLYEHLFPGHEELAYQSYFKRG